MPGTCRMIELEQMPAAPAVTSPGNLLAVRGTSFSQAIIATGFPLPTFSATSLPGGLTISTTTGVISGTPNTAGISNVTVTATNVETNVVATAITDAKGVYQIRYLNSGTYSVEAKLEGFKPVIKRGVTVRIGERDGAGIMHVLAVLAVGGRQLLDAGPHLPGHGLDDVGEERYRHDPGAALVPEHSA